MDCQIFNEYDFGMIEGSAQTINLDLYNIMGEAYENILITRVEWRLSRYGETECLVSKSSDENPTEVIYNNNNIEITLLPQDTYGFYGKFTHQILIEDLHRIVFISDLGKISIKPQIK